MKILWGDQYPKPLDNPHNVQGEKLCLLHHYMYYDLIAINFNVIS